MGYKTISISDDVYARLSALKRRGESFTNLFIRLTETKKPKLSNFYGRWRMSDKEEHLMFKDLKSMWGKWNESSR